MTQEMEMQNIQNNNVNIARHQPLNNNGLVGNNGNDREFQADYNRLQNKIKLSNNGQNVLLGNDDEEDLKLLTIDNERLKIKDKAMEMEMEN
eukprot:CAMPEP_0116926930 /NCGR_PEP_ID=MMETSP0467-20121206/25025_1 /TAXON_ID=283647 /ORGANISM="Mesodinium pulex, Strain SPMC105" /LENGTH=91 /DNA_ID=CAMNT_0004606295 /DNA_START=584 /DNA_END=860 /DNA_ORIENTATION=+